MLRATALAAVLATLLLSATGARAEPLDLDLVRLGSPSPEVWGVVAEYADPGNLLDAQTRLRLANESKQRFAMLATELGLGMSSALLQPGSTTGHSGFDVDFEAAYAQVHAGVVGSGTAAYPARDYWPTRGLTPHELFLPSLHVRKALPFSFELGGRLIYLSQSSYWASQLEGKWALNEGFWWLPDLAVRAAHTTLWGHKDLALGVTDLDLIVSRKFAVNNVVGFTPYLAARFAYLRANGEQLDFAPNRAVDPDYPDAEPNDTKSAFPKLRATHYRTTFGVRMTTYAVSMALEVTHFGGADEDGESTPAANEYPDYEVASSLTGAFKFGFEW
jgi:hypothetical protein